MKRKALISSILSIMLCLSLITGSTFALFTSEARLNIAVTSGKVELVADIANIRTWSLESDKTADGATDGSFTQGGSATFKEGILSLCNIIPGDKVSFDITAKNNSTVNVQYRVKLVCTEGTQLMEALSVSIGGKTYRSIASYTSAWAPLPAGGEMTPFSVSIEMPEDVASTYQGKDAKIAVTVEAVQGNATVSGDIDVVGLMNGSSTLFGNINDVVNVEKGQNIDLNLNENAINNSIFNNGSTTISNGTIEVGAVGFENYGDATLTDIVMNAGSPVDYGFIALAGSNSTLNNTDLISGGGGVGAADGAQVEFESGSVAVNSTSTSGRYNFYAVGEGTVITIEDGEFSFSKEFNQKRAYIYAGNGATVYVKGGNFGKASTRSGYEAGILTDNGTVVITGGSFGFDPISWVPAEGYEVTKENDVWTVSPSIKSNSDLEEAINAGKTTLILAAGTYNIPSAAQNKTLTFVGTKASIVTVNTVDTNAGGATMTFEGITIQGQTSGDYAGWGNGAQVHFKDCTINGKITLYGKEASFTDCVFNNKSDYSVWTWGAENVSFTNCVFNSGGKALLVYGEYRTATVKVDSCKFYDDDTLNTNKAAIEIGSDRAPHDSYTIVITDTTVNGFAVNPDGIPTGTTLWANKNSMPTDKLSVMVDGVKTY